MCLLFLPSLSFLVSTERGYSQKGSQQQFFHQVSILLVFCFSYEFVVWQILKEGRGGRRARERGRKGGGGVCVRETHKETEERKGNGALQKEKREQGSTEKTWRLMLKESFSFYALLC